MTVGVVLRLEMVDIGKGDTARRIGADRALIFSGQFGIHGGAIAQARQGVQVRHRLAKCIPNTDLPVTKATQRRNSGKPLSTMASLICTGVRSNP